MSAPPARVGEVDPFGALFFPSVMLTGGCLVGRCPLSGARRPMLYSRPVHAIPSDPHSMPPSPTRIFVPTGPYRTVIQQVATDPVDFLAAFAGNPRGFWGCGDRWVAWAGELARIRFPGTGTHAMGTHAEEGSRSASPGHPFGHLLSRFDADRRAHV